MDGGVHKRIDIFLTNGGFVRRNRLKERMKFNEEVFGKKYCAQDEQKSYRESMRSKLRIWTKR